MSLTSKQRAFLKSEAHTLKPIVQIGKNGLNDHIKTSVRNALDARELIKVTLLQNTMEDITRAIRQIESGDIGSVRNVPLDDFEPAKIVKSILEATR